MVNVSTEGGFRFSSPTVIPRGGIVGYPLGRRNYDNLPDGRIAGIGSPMQSATAAGPHIRGGGQLVRRPAAACAGEIIMTTPPIIAHYRVVSKLRESGTDEMFHFATTSAGGTIKSSI
jgi:hypothetical protein